MQFNSFPFREYVTVFKKSTDGDFVFAKMYFPLGNLLNKAATIIGFTVENLGSNSVSFKLQSGKDDSSINTITSFTDVAGQAFTVTPGGVVNVAITLEESTNALQFVLTSDDASSLMVVGYASSDPVFLTTPERDYQRDIYGESAWDTSVEVSVAPPLNVSTLRSFSVTPTWTHLPSIPGTAVVVTNTTGANVSVSMDSGSNYVTIPNNNSPMNVAVASDASELSIRAATAASGVQVVVT